MTFTQHLNDILLRDLCPRGSVKCLKGTIVNPGCHSLNGRSLEILIKLTFSLIGGLKHLNLGDKSVPVTFDYSLLQF